MLRSDGILLRRYGGESYRAGQVTWKYGPWDQVSWWTGETDPQQAVALLKSRGYDLSEHDPVPIDKSAYGPNPGHPPSASAKAPARRLDFSSRSIAPTNPLLAPRPLA